MFQDSGATGNLALRILQSSEIQKTPLWCLHDIIKKAFSTDLLSSQRFLVVAFLLGGIQESGDGWVLVVLRETKWSVAFCRQVVWAEGSGGSLGRQADRMPSSSWEGHDLPAVWFCHCIVLWLMTRCLTFLCPDFCLQNWLVDPCLPPPKDNFHSLLIKKFAVLSETVQSEVMPEEQEPSICGYFTSFVLKQTHFITFWL